MPSVSQGKSCFGPFVLDSQSGELFKLGHKLNIRGQPIEVLSILIEHSGEVVTREELCKRLWPQDTFVDFEHSLNTAIKKLRQALDDYVETPRYIETLPKKGYRFVGRVEPVRNGDEATSSTLTDGKPQPLEDKKRKRRPLVWAIAALALVAGVGAILYEMYRPRIPVVVGMRQLTNTKHPKATNTWRFVATDGNRVYFDEIFEGRARIAQVSVMGGEVSYLDLPGVHDPRVKDVSSDGTRLLFTDFRYSESDLAWIYTLPNGPARKLPFTIGYMAFRFLPGTKQLVYALGNDSVQPARLFLSDEDGEHAHPILSGPATIMSISISPDRERIRFLAETNPASWESRLNGAEMKPFRPELSPGRGCWSPDGKSYAFTASGPEGRGVWAESESRLGPFRFKAQPRPLVTGPLSIHGGITMSQDGKQIFAIGQILRGELSVYEPESGLFRKYLNGISAAFLDFSRDGQWVTYVAYPEGTLWRSRVDGSERLQLTFPPMNSLIYPRWSPDGRLIVFMQWDPRREIYAVPADGGAPMLLLGGDFQPSDPTWSPDGKFIAYAGADRGPSEVRILELATKQSRTLPNSAGLFSPRWSPDGRYIAALAQDRHHMLLYDLTAEKWITMRFSQSPEIGGWQVWSHDSRYLYWQTGNIYRARLPDGDVELVVDLSGIDTTCPIFLRDSFSLTPDDRVIVLRDRGVDEIFALDLEYR